MAISIYYYRDEPNAPHRTFLCDSVEDIKNLPTQTTTTKEFTSKTPTGSIALVADEKNGTSVWILNNKGKWVEL